MEAATLRVPPLRSAYLQRISFRPQPHQVPVTARRTITRTRNWDLNMTTTSNALPCSPKFRDLASLKPYLWYHFQASLISHRPTRKNRETIVARVRCHFFSERLCDLIESIQASRTSPHPHTAPTPHSPHPHTTPAATPQRSVTSGMSCGMS